MKLVPILMLLALAGCASSPPPETEWYLLRSDTPVAGDDSGEAVQIAIGTVQVATYINRSGIVVETASGTMRPANYHQWAEPLREGINTFLAGEVSSLIGQPVRAGSSQWRSHTATTIDIQIQELHGTLDGEAKLSARWAVIDTDRRKILSEHSLTGRERLRADGYGALVDAEKRLLQDLARAIAKSLQPSIPLARQ